MIRVANVRPESVVSTAKLTNFDSSHSAIASEKLAARLNVSHSRRVAR